MNGAWGAGVAAGAWLAALLGSWIGFDSPHPLPGGGSGPLWLVLPVGAGILALAAGFREPPDRGGVRARLAAAIVVAGIAGWFGAARASSVTAGPLANMVAQAPVEAIHANVVLVSDPRPGSRGGWWALARVAEGRVPGVGPLSTGGRLVVRGREAAPAGLGATLRIRGLPAAITGDATAWFNRQGAAVEVRAADPVVARAPPGWLAATSRIRDRVAEAAHRHLPVERASLLTGLTTGDVRRQPPTLADAMTAAGLSHLVAVSGSNVALVVGATLVLAVALRLGRRGGWWASLCAVWWFVVLVRIEPSVLRAALMATLVLVASLIGRARSAGSLLASAVVVALLIDPLLAGRLGFVLSVAATVGVLALAPPVRQRLRGPPALRGLVAATLGAQAAVAPVLILTGGTVGPSALLANVVAVPAAGMAGAVGGVAAVASLLAPAAASGIAAIASPALGVVVWSAETFSGPVGQRVDELGPAVLVLGAALAVVATLPRTRRAVAVAAVVAVPLIGLGALDARTGPMPDRAVVIALDVGQGDAVLLGDPAGGWTLVDGGPDPVALRRGLRRHGVGSLRTVVLSHPHADHADGLAGVLGHLEIGSLVVGPLAEDHDVVAQARAAGVPVVAATAGARWRTGTTAVRVLSPPPGGIATDANESSLVLRVDVDGGASALLAGDAELIAQTRLLTEPVALDVDVLKVPHHGGDTNAEGFLAATTPEIAVISAGEGNPFGHPHPDVLAALAGVEVHRTDRDGDVIIRLTTGW